MRHGDFVPSIAIVEYVYARSALLRYIEEALAESYAQVRVYGIKGLPSGLTFPVRESYVTVSQVLTEGAIGTVVIGGTTYVVYVISDSEFNNERE